MIGPGQRGQAIYYYTMGVNRTSRAELPSKLRPFDNMWVF